MIAILILSSKAPQWFEYQHLSLVSSSLVSRPRCWKRVRLHRAGYTYSCVSSTMYVLPGKEVVVQRFKSLYFKIELKSQSFESGKIWEWFVVYGLFIHSCFIIFLNWCSHKYDFSLKDYVNLITKTKHKKEKERKTTTTTVTRKVHYV